MVNRPTGMGMVMGGGGGGGGRGACDPLETCPFGLIWTVSQ